MTAGDKRLQVIGLEAQENPFWDSNLRSRESRGQVSTQVQRHKGTEDCRWPSSSRERPTLLLPLKPKPTHVAEHKFFHSVHDFECHFLQHPHRHTE